MNDFTGGQDRIYGGVRMNLETIANPPSQEALPYLPLLIADLPLSFAFDTLSVGGILYRDLHDGPSVDPLKDWKAVSPRTNNSKELRLAEIFPFEAAVRDDVAAHLNRKADKDSWNPETLTLKSDYTCLSFHEDGEGRRAVRIWLPWARKCQDKRVITLIYDAQGRRTQTLTWRYFHRPSRC